MSAHAASREPKTKYGRIRTLWTLLVLPAVMRAMAPPKTPANPILTATPRAAERNLCRPTLFRRFLPLRLACAGRSHGAFPGFPNQCATKEPLMKSFPEPSKKVPEKRSGKIVIVHQKNEPSSRDQCEKRVRFCLYSRKCVFTQGAGKNLTASLPPGSQTAAPPPHGPA